MINFISCYPWKCIMLWYCCYSVKYKQYITNEITLVLINGYYGLYTPTYSRCHLLRVTRLAISPLFHGMRSLNNSAWMAQDTSDGLVTKTSPERSLAPIPSPFLPFSPPFLPFLALPYSLPIPSFLFFPFPSGPFSFFSSPFSRPGGRLPGALKTPGAFRAEDPALYWWQNRLRVKCRCIVSTTAFDYRLSADFFLNPHGLKPFRLIFGLAEFTRKIDSLIYG